MRSVTVVELLVTYISLGWAYVLLTTPDLFNQSPSFNFFIKISMEEFTLGIIVLIIALFKVVGILLKNVPMRWIGLLLSSIFWCFTAATQLASNGELQINTGFVVYSGVAIMCLWTSKEVVRDGR